MHFKWMWPHSLHLDAGLFRDPALVQLKYLFKSIQDLLTFSMCISRKNNKEMDKSCFHSLMFGVMHSNRTKKKTVRFLYAKKMLALLIPVLFLQHASHWSTFLLPHQTSQHASKLDILDMFIFVLGIIQQARAEQQLPLRPKIASCFNIDRRWHQEAWQTICYSSHNATWWI